ncbi:putative transposase, Ptta/En/Spm, plant [Senna tora]|uniref:Putative transposase, Ptta/En/Spm, plant n=1 Tax=Senna tora TaxID=362788 RepID=A0A834SQB8_9FABA|nr:putative transposase, Ptta/En/Spm, plant [Senna tora]
MVDGKYGLVDVDYRSKLKSNEPFILAEQAQQVYYTKYPVSGSRVNGEWWAACKVRAKLFMDETLNSVGEVSNEFSTFDYYQDDESLIIHDRTPEEKEINLLDLDGLMEEVNVDELPNPMNAPHTDQFIDDDEETNHNEFLDSDEELFDSDSRSPLVTTPSASASPIDANNSRDFASPSPELLGASTGHILDSVESTVPHARVDRRKVITVEENGTRFGPVFVTLSIMSSVFGRMPFATEHWRDYSVEVKEELFKEFMDKYQFQSDNDRKMARDVWEKTCSDRYSDILTKHGVKILDELKTRDMAKLKGHGPARIRVEVWDGLVDIWLTPEWQKKSEAAKRSRATAPDALARRRFYKLRCTQEKDGITNFIMRLSKIKRFLGEMYTIKPTRRKMVNLYLSAPSILLLSSWLSFELQNFVTYMQENLDIALLDKYGEESSSYPEVIANLWLDVAPHSKKGQIHGLGQGLQLSSGSPNSTSSVCSTTSTTAPIIPQSQIDEAVSRAMATMWSTQMALMLQSFMSQVNQAPTRSSQGEERQSTPANDDNDDADDDLGV